MKPGKTGLARLFNATGYSIKGLRAAFRMEAAFRQELLLAVIMIPAAFWLANDAIRWVLLVSPVLLLLIVELLNSAIEAVVDRISDEKHELSGIAKDMGSAAVMISLLLIATTWGAIAWEKFYA